MSQSNVGTAAVYEAGDQRNVAEADKPQPEPYNEGKKHSHQANDPKDERSIGNRLAAAEPQNDDESGKKKTQEQILGEKDPLAPARLHGNEPSSGAKKDAEILADEEEEIRKKDEAKAQSKAAKKH